MAPELNDLSDLVDRLSRDTFADGGVEWVGELVRRLIDESGLDADIVLGDGSGRDKWDIEVTVGEATVALIDVVPDIESPLDYVERVQAKACRRWRHVPRAGDDLAVRPWIGAVALARIDESNEIADQLDALVRCRTLDAALSNSRHHRAKGSPLGVGPFAAALLGRLHFARVVVGSGSHARTV